VQEGKAWARGQGAAAPERKLVNLFYAAGARKVFVDLERGRDGRPAKVYAELPPTNPANRAPIFQVHFVYRRTNKLEPNPQPEKDHGQRFLVVEVKQ
jgi:hypothetical protein